jgi:hypothetical protein
MDKTETLKKLELLKDHFDNGRIPQLHKHEVNPGLDIGSRENYLYFIMTCSLNFQRSSPKTWQSALDTWNDEGTRFVFFPERVVESQIEDLRTALVKHKLALQPYKHIDIWGRLSKTFNQHFQNDPRKLFELGEYDAEKILQILQKDMKPAFPYLSGLKLSNYSLFILLKYSNLKLRNTESISIIPDTHIMQATSQLGILESDKVNPQNVSLAWKELLKDSGFSPLDFHSILWNWSRNDFKPGV